MYECILEWLSVLYHLRVTATLTSDLILIIIVSGAYLLLFEIGIPNLVCECIMGMVECLVPFTGHCDLDLWPSF